MNPFIEAVETALCELRERLFESLEVDHEFRDDLLEFGEPALGAEEDQRQKRHQEWFLLERPSVVLGAIPLERFFDGLDEGQVSSQAEIYASLRGSRTGVFRVARVVDGDGLVLDDLLGRGQYAVPEAALASEFLPGDLVVGRLYPEDLGSDGEKTLWGLSSAAATFRNKELREALERDLEAMRSRARGPLRMTQHDVEEMFFSNQVRVAEAKDGPPQKSLEETELAARALFAEGGIEAARASEFLKTIANNPLPETDVALGADDPLGWILNELAFETDVDLARARAVLSDYWKAASLHGDEPEQEVGDQEAPNELAAAALARFDAGRAAGHDLDSLFATLESDLGIEGEGPAISGIPNEALEEGIDGEPAPDFPGVLGALMQEFLWDGARLAETDLDAFAREHRDLELFVQFASFLGNADDLSSNHIELFIGRWIWEEGRLVRGGYRAAGVLRSTRAFCEWLADGHSNEVLASIDDFLATVEEDVERLQSLNASSLVTDPGASRTQFFEFVSAEGGRGRWLDKSGGTFEGELQEGGEELKSGDLVAAQVIGDELRIQAVYPPLASPYLKATS